MSNNDIGARFSTVIVNYNGGSLLSECVNSALREGVSPKQIIIVDNGSQDDSPACIERNTPGVKIIRNVCNAGFARAVNQALASAKGDFILLLNNDAQLLPGALHAFAEAFEQVPLLAIAGGQLCYPNGRLQNAVAPLPTLAAELLPRALLKLTSPRRFSGKPAANAPVPVESVIGACLVVRQSILPQLGFMDEDYFFFLEETDWCRRARQLGFEVCYVPAARVIHAQGYTANRFRSHARIEFQRSKLIYFKKTRSRVAYLIVSALLPIKSLINAASNTLACVITLFAVKRVRSKVRGYWRITAWHALGRPSNWGLPGKCPRRPDQS